LTGANKGWGGGCGKLRGKLGRLGEQIKNFTLTSSCNNLDQQKTKVTSQGDNSKGDLEKQGENAGGKWRKKGSCHKQGMSRAEPKLLIDL